MLKQIRKYGYLGGLFGFFGCFGFRYFSSHNVGDIFYFSFFAFFAFFLIGKLSHEMPDERFKLNSQKAAEKAASIPALAVFLVGWSASHPFGTREFMVIISTLAWIGYMLTYAILFYYYEKN